MEGDPDPCPEDEEFFVRPDAGDMEEAIDKFFGWAGRPGAQWTRELEDVVLEIMEDPVFKGNQNFSFEMDVDKNGKRLFGGGGECGSRLPDWTTEVYTRKY